ncbi:hypothetical protein TIFTF001_004335 [Ficus carica]|uniref:Pentatricopeptide repeat-containing protein n=1 Tax=Ficus carica TaxID=3494 RepID=A0AA87ZBA1_FICCA|nr:hypothetical protein TIFTF001_004335 [Ficus carica]
MGREKTQIVPCILGLLNGDFANQIRCSGPAFQCLFPRRRFLRVPSDSTSVSENGLGNLHIIPRTRFNVGFGTASNGFLRSFEQFSLYSFYSTKPMSRSFRGRASKRRKANSKPSLDEARFQRAVSQLLPRFTPEELGNVMAQQDDPLVCLELFNWASQQPRFRHGICTYHIAIKKLGVAKMYQEMDEIVNQVACSHSFWQMVNNGIEPDIFSLNSMVKGYVLSLHVNDALRIFHQIGVVYNCLPNSFTYDYLIHGLCSQGRTDNARELCSEMKSKGFVPSAKSYNSLVNALAINEDVEAAVKYLWEMIEQQRSADFITYRTLLDEVCRRGRVEEAMRLLKEFQEKDLVDGHTYRKLLYVPEDDFGHSTDQNRFRYSPRYFASRAPQRGANLGEWRNGQLSLCNAFNTNGSKHHPNQVEKRHIPPTNFMFSRNSNSGFKYRKLILRTMKPLSVQCLPAWD